VFNGQQTFESIPSPNMQNEPKPIVQPFSFVFVLTTPFDYNPAADGNLILDSMKFGPVVNNLQHNNNGREGTLFAAVCIENDETSIVDSGNVANNGGSNSEFALVTQFTTIPIPGPPSSAPTSSPTSPQTGEPTSPPTGGPTSPPSKIIATAAAPEEVGSTLVDNVAVLVGLSSLLSDIVALNDLIPTEDALIPLLNPNDLIPTEEVLVPVLNPLTSQADNALNVLNDNFAAFFARFFPGN
jgi:hypothetical protein